MSSQGHAFNNLSYFSEALWMILNLRDFLGIKEQRKNPFHAEKCLHYADRHSSN